MPLCGFNEQMIDGLRRFGEGLYSQAEQRAVTEGVSLRQSFDQEIAEMELFLGLLAEKDPSRYQALRGITHLAQALYRAGQGQDAPKEAYMQGLQVTLDAFVELDRTYYDQLRPHAPPAEALRQLGELLV